jgi:molybdopterin converting factor small subunit
MTVTVSFFSWFKDLAGCSRAAVSLPEGATIDVLLRVLWTLYPRLEPMQKSMLIAVGVDYQNRDYVLKAGDEIALFPPVQGG